MKHFASFNVYLDKQGGITYEKKTHFFTRNHGNSFIACRLWNDRRRQ